MVQDHEGNLGQSADYSWLGVLHVRIDPEWIATTGIVLIKTKYALAIADDVARIPQHIFKSDSRAMFLPTRDKPWFVDLVSYVTHPEYEISSLNSIAIIELDLDDLEEFPLTPVCLATVKIFSASRYIYLAGFTHENQTLEKVFYKIEHLDEEVCKEFYNRTELSPQMPLPSAQLCGHTPNIESQCIWDNGMTLLSNDFGYLNLIGFGIHGPGCTDPARFIDLFPYFHWINFITGSVGYRRNDQFLPNIKLNEFVPKSKRKGPQNIPVHELFTKGNPRRQDSSILHHYEAYPFDADVLKFHLVKPTKDDKTYLIFPFNEQWAYNETTCELPSVVIYEEVFQVTAVDRLQGSATYKLSLYDTIKKECMCVRLTVNSDSRSEAILSFKEEFNFKEDTYQSGALGDMTPEDVLIQFPYPIMGVPAPLHQPEAINDRGVLTKKVKNYDLYITFKFTGHAELKFEMLAERQVPRTSTSTEPPEPKNSTDESTDDDSDSETRVLRAMTIPVPVPWQPVATSRTDKPEKRTRTKKPTKLNTQKRQVDRTESMFRGSEEYVEARVDEVHETQSEARGEGTPGVVMTAAWLLAAAVIAPYINK
ncbi:hypothetical protein PYW07_010330 [Mythimna separata]|uniref:Peptidase S1 domain-containing protein n=1 Tax=Mythimna separata TaxID=271217 RepID=A0AAD7YAE5_MYTSE|nr:hypothetical protein PYW07_010330 [Mythimna separata]